MQAALNAVNDGVNKIVASHPLESTDAQGAVTDVQLDVDFQTTATFSTPLAASSGVLQAGGSLALEVKLAFQVAIGADFDPVSHAATFYLNSNKTDQLVVTANITGTNLNAAVKLGFIDVQAGGGAAMLGAQVTAAMIDPNSDGRLTLAELNQGALSSLVQTSVSANPAPSLSMSVTSSLLPAAQPVTLHWSDVNDPSSVSVDPSSSTAYQGLSKLAPSVITSGLTQLSTWAQGLADQNLLGRHLPLVGRQLADDLNLSGLLQKDLVTQLGSYDSVDALLAKLQSAGDLSNAVQRLDDSQRNYSIRSICASAFRPTCRSTWGSTAPSR